MGRKKQQKPFRAVSAVKALARKRLGSPPPGRVSPNQKKNQGLLEKHKLTLERLLDEER
jgi:hypothetical protein